MKPSAVPVIPGIHILKDRYAAWLCDVWGVAHNGVRPFVAAVDALSRFREQGGLVVLVTNAPRPSGPIYDQLEQIGVSREAFDAVVTSGDATRSHLETLGQAPVFHLGPARDQSLFEDLNLTLVDAKAAEVVLCTGLGDDTSESPDDYRDLLVSFAARGINLICANPDIVVDRGGQLFYCAGALGELYQRLGGVTRFFGKPHPPIYDLAFSRLCEVAGRPIKRTEVLAIGDGLKTDIAGASTYGIDALFIAGGIHIGEIADGADGIDTARLAALFAANDAQPVAAQYELAW